MKAKHLLLQLCIHFARDGHNGRIHRAEIQLVFGCVAVSKKCSPKVRESHILPTRAASPD